MGKNMRMNFFKQRITIVLLLVVGVYIYSSINEFYFFEKDYYEYTFNYLKLFEEDEKIYVYLLNDDNITLEKLNYSLLSSNMNEWIPYGFVFYYDK